MHAVDSYGPNGPTWINKTDYSLQVCGLIYGVLVCGLIKCAGSCADILLRLT